MQVLKLMAALGLALGLSAGAMAADKGGPEQLLEQLPKASPASPWSGVYMGVHGGRGWAVVDVSAFGGSIEGFAADGWLGGVHGGIDAQIPGSKIVLRGRCAYTWGSEEFSVNPGLFSASIEDGWSCDGGVGYAMGSALPYIFGGWAKNKTAASFLGKSVGGTPDVEGYRMGGGVEWRTALANATVALDYTYTNYKDLTFGPVTVDPDDHRVMLRLNFRLGAAAAQ